MSINTFMYASSTEFETPTQPNPLLVGSVSNRIKKSQIDYFKETLRWNFRNTPNNSSLHLGAYHLRFTSRGLRNYRCSRTQKPNRKVRSEVGAHQWIIRYRQLSVCANSHSVKF